MFGRKAKESKIVESELEDVPELDAHDPKPKGRPSKALEPEEEQPKVMLVTENQLILERLAQIKAKLDKLLELAQE